MLARREVASEEVAQHEIEQMGEERSEEHRGRDNSRHRHRRDHDRHSHDHHNSSNHRHYARWEPETEGIKSEGDVLRIAKEAHRLHSESGVGLKPDDVNERKTSPSDETGTGSSAEEGEPEERR
ncbi:hypothetical protein OQA88_7059 [Cercophora sp. LCS_1]